MFFCALFRETDPEKEENVKEELLLEYLQTVCPGRKRAQKSARLEGKLQISGDGLRSLVNKLRRRGEPIASGPCGYFYALNAGEVYNTIQRLKKMIRGLEAAVRGLEEALERFCQGDDASG